MKRQKQQHKRHQIDTKIHKTTPNDTKNKKSPQKRQKKRDQMDTKMHETTQKQHKKTKHLQKKTKKDKNEHHAVLKKT